MSTIHNYDKTKDYTDFKGAVRRMPEHVYFAHTGLSQTSIKQWAKSVEDGMAGSTFDGKKSTSASMGSAVHCQLLDGLEEFHARYVTGGPVNLKTGNIYGRETKKFESWLDLQDGANFVTGYEMHAIEKMCESVRRDEFAMSQIDMPGSEKELSIFWTEMVNGQTIRCRGRLDWFNPLIGVIDLKTTAEVDDDGFARGLVKFGWYTQAWWYMRGLKQIGLAPDGMSWGWIVIQNAKPFKVRLYNASDALLASGMVNALDAMVNLAGYMANGKEFTQSSGFSAIDLPKWAKANDYEIARAMEVLR